MLTEDSLLQLGFTKREGDRGYQLRLSRNRRLTYLETFSGTQILNLHMMSHYDTERTFQAVNLLTSVDDGPITRPRLQSLLFVLAPDNPSDEVNDGENLT